MFIYLYIYIYAYIYIFIYIYIYIYIHVYIYILHIDILHLRIYKCRFQVSIFFLLDLQHLNLILYALCFSLEYGEIETYH